MAIEPTQIVSRNVVAPSREFHAHSTARAAVDANVEAVRDCIGAEPERTQLVPVEVAGDLMLCAHRCGYLPRLLITNPIPNPNSNAKQPIITHRRETGRGLAGSGCEPPPSALVIVAEG